MGRVSTADWEVLLTGGLVLAAAGEVPFPGFVAVASGEIVAVDRLAALPSRPAARRVIDTSDMLVMPGLVNGHCHAAMTLFRGLADDLPLERWLQEYIFPAEARLVSPAMVEACSRLAAAEMLLGGTTTVADGYFFEHEAALALRAAGMRVVAGQGIVDFPAPGVPDPKENLAAAASFLAGDFPASVTPALFCHAVYTCSPATLCRAKDLAREHGRPWFIHLAETRDEVARCRAAHGVSPLGLLHRLGLLDPDTVLVHCVHLDGADLELLAASGAGVVHCPESNLKMASGVAPLAAMLAAGVPVGLGTDSAASNNDLDLFGEMRTCALVHKGVSGDATALPAAKVLEMATTTGARVLGLAGEVGRLAKGMRADIVVLRLAQPHLTPFYSPDLLVYAGRGSDVDTVLVDGRIVVQGGELLTMDLAAVRKEVATLAREAGGG